MSRSTDLKLLAEKYQQVMEQINGVDPKVVQYIDQMQIPGLPGAAFANLAKSDDPYDAQVIQTIQNLMQKGVPATKFRDTLMQAMKPEVEKAVQQGLSPQQINQNMQANPHMITQYLTQAAQQLMGGAKPVAAPAPASGRRV